MAKEGKRGREDQPVNNIVWRHRDELKPNNYNPNAVAPPEMKLLKISILEDGWTQPIVMNPDDDIVDGFHRWIVSGDKDVYEQTGGYVPTVTISPKDKASQKMSTIRHNRARGTHAVLKMADIVQGMVEEKLSMQEICHRLQMEKEEVIRLANKKGIPKTDIVQDHSWSKSWVPE
jgi:ParB-like chromosome segregation protein Spo0J